MIGAKVYKTYGGKAALMELTKTQKFTLVCPFLLPLTVGAFLALAEQGKKSLWSIPCIFLIFLFARFLLRAFLMGGKLFIVTRDRAMGIFYYLLAPLLYVFVVFPVLLSIGRILVAELL